ncbi:MAG: flagellar type III secretion system pore protein FliP [Treponema sp.]|nr:flagellar type III secretion system pore protein FliP [Treponema sp.]
MRHAISVFFTKQYPRILIIALITVFCLFPATSQQNQGFPGGTARGNTEMNRDVRNLTIPNIDISVTQPQTGNQIAFSLQLLLMLTVLTLAPSILILMTTFLRFSIVLDFIKRALSLQQVPPTAVLNGIAFFMTIFIMWPVFNRIYTDAYRPLSDGQITIQEAYVQAETPLKTFMLGQIKGDWRGLAMFMSMAKLDRPNNPNDVPMYALIPAYILHELTVAFKIGIILYIPFIVIDMVVASVLMSMGMMMLPPVQISMPFKLILFVLVDGWHLLTQQLFNSVTL